MDRKVLSEAVYYGIGKYSTVAVTLLTTAVLARLISPAEHGVVTVVTVFTAFFAVLADMGLGTAVVQNKSLTRNEIDDIFSFSVYTALGLGALFALLGFPIALFYGNSEYRLICLLLSFAVFFNAVNIIPNAVLMKGKRFKTVGIRMICVAVTVSVLTILMAYCGFRYYAIVFQSILQAAFILAWNMKNAGLKFHFHFDRASIEKVKGYSAFQFCYSLINYFARNLDNLLIGKLMGEEPLGYYDKGYKLMMYPIQNLTYVLNPLLHPILADYQHERRRIYDSYVNLARLLSLIGAYVSLVCFLNSKEIIMLFFGGQWERSVPVFHLLSVSVWPQMIATSAGSVYQSTGNTRLMFKSGVVHFTVTILMIIIGILLGSLETVAAFVSASLYLRFFIDFFFLVRRNFGYSYGEFLTVFTRDGLLMAAGIALGCFLPEEIGGMNGIVFFLMKALGLTLVFLAVLTVSGQGKMILQLIKGKKKG